MYRIEITVQARDDADEAYAWMVDSIGVVVVDGTTFTNNTAATVGGGISSAGYVYVTGSEFIGNTASAGGGIANFGLLYVGTSDFLGNFPDDILGPYFDLGGNGSIVND
jgi:predicted outer membrane repeat protein